MDILNDNGIPKEFSACQVPGGNYIYTIPISLLTQREMILLIKSIQTQVEDDFLRATLVAAQNHIPKSSIN